MYFRHIKEGEGGTLPITGDNIKPRVGTFYLMTCVGVHFRIDKNRCFFAHIDAGSAEFERYAMVIKKAGEEIARQVKCRLRDFLQEDQWDIKDPFFGKDLAIEAPCLRDQVYKGRSYETAARYVVRGIREFFSACGRVLQQETQHVHKSPAPRDTKNTVMKKHLDDVDQIEKKAEFLDHQAQHANLDDKHHILIVDSQDGKVIRRGRVRDPNRRAEESDLQWQVPEHINTLKPDLWRLGVLEDERLAFLPEKLASLEKAAELREELQGYRDKYVDFGGKPKGRMQERLTEILERK